MYRIIVSSLLLILSLSSTANDWVTVDFGPLATIDMPGTPQDSVRNGQDYYEYDDSFETYRFYSGPCEFKTQRGALNKFYSDYTQKVLDVQQGQLLTHSDAYVDGLKAREIEYTTTKYGKEEFRRMRLIFANNVLYSYSHTYVKGHAELALDGEKYIKSFKLKRAYGGLNQLGQPIKFPKYFLYIYFGFIAFFLGGRVIAILLVVFLRKNIF